MFVIFISFIFISIVPVSRTTENKNVPFNDKLRRSVTHLKDMLFAIEGKIKQEKTKLSQIGYKLRRKLNPAAARTDTDTTVKPSSDVLTPKDNYNIDTMETTLETPEPKFTFATLFPTPPNDNFWPSTEMTDTTVITDFSVFLVESAEVITTATESSFLKDIKKTMAEDNHNYFTAFLTRFTELVAIKKPHETTPVINLMLITMSEKMNTVLFNDAVGKRLTETLKMFHPMLIETPPEKLKEQAMFAHFTLKNKEKMMTPAYKEVTDFYGQYFNQTDGEELFKALEAFYEYNNGKHTAKEVSEMIWEAVISPYIRLKDTLNTSGDAVNETTEFPVNITKFPAYTRQNPLPLTRYPVQLIQYPLNANQNPLHPTQYPEHPAQYPANPFQNSVNAKQYPVNPSQYPVNPNQYPVHPSQYPVQPKQYPAYATEYPAYVPTSIQYEVPSWRRNFKQKIRNFVLKRPKLIKKIKHQYESIQKNIRYHIPRNKRLDQPYRKSSDGQLGKREQSSKRAYISSGEVNNHPKYYQDNDQNHMLHKIREVTSYSDEEDHLRNNLHDALRHGNRTFASFRKSDGDIINKRTLQELSSESDEEWVLKNNIYKVFEQKQDQLA